MEKELKIWPEQYTCASITPTLFTHPFTHAFINMVNIYWVSTPGLVLCWTCELKTIFLPSSLWCSREIQTVQWCKSWQRKWGEAWKLSRTLSQNIGRGSGEASRGSLTWNWKLNMSYPNKGPCIKRAERERGFQEGNAQRLRDLFPRCVNWSLKGKKHTRCNVIHWDKQDTTPENKELKT